jgi:hypothetical protein
MCNLSGVAALLGIEDGMKNAEEGRIMWEGMTPGNLKRKLNMNGRRGNLD